MQANKIKFENTQLPNQVAAESQFQKLIDDYFNFNGLEEINQLLIALAGAATGPDLHPPKHKRMAIANALFEVRLLINLLSKTRALVNAQPFVDDATNPFYKLTAVGHFDVDHLTDLLFSGLEAYTAQDKGFEGATLAFSVEITSAFKMIYDWLSDCEAWRSGLN